MMKYSLIIIVIAIISIYASCQKGNMMNNTFNVDTQKYEAQLNQDYTQASQFHSALIITKSLVSKKSMTNDTLYNRMMYNKNDSLFSEHFYLFCIDMMNNSGMMGSGSGMMGSGNMMNGGTMGSMLDMNKMMDFMESLHTSSQNMMNPVYFNTDSLMHNQMTMCTMMTSKTDGVENVFTKMQKLRKDHQLMP